MSVPVFHGNRIMAIVGVGNKVAPYDELDVRQLQLYFSSTWDLIEQQRFNLEREAMFWHYPHYGNQGGTPGSSVLCGDYKLIEFFEDGRLELYNLREDVSEERNLADEEPQIAKELKTMLTVWREKVEAKIPEPNPDYRDQ